VKKNLKKIIALHKEFAQQSVAKLIFTIIIEIIISCAVVAIPEIIIKLILNLL
jgi:hypothetical protein